ncbi:hypothetical protein [Leptospira bouyouniensis]|uniref:Uncharacterized protein n=1 Tax=Leptospira bouyouniensis TaxID=2484911 RepID=A0ABY2KZ91_9LEPT|nr:hypothetical protein [Leptospira bouyouniensis]TGK45908.1 hypothetical protein EHQ10_18565 [Leptospira bouyouniensis]
MIYWWTESFRQWYLGAEKVGENVAVGLNTTDNFRFLRSITEISKNKINLIPHSEVKSDSANRIIKFQPYLTGSKGKRWFDNHNSILLWENNGKEKFALHLLKGGGGAQSATRDPGYFRQGIAYSYIGTEDFFCRLRKYQSIFDVSGSSIFVENPEEVQVALSSRIIPYVSQSINPTINNQVGDIKNLPIPKVKHWKDYIERARVLYDKEFSKDEINIEYEYRGEV